MPSNMKAIHLNSKYTNIRLKDMQIQDSVPPLPSSTDFWASRTAAQPAANKRRPLALWRRPSTNKKGKQFSDQRKPQMDPSNEHQFLPYLSVSVRSLTIIAEKHAPPKKKANSSLMLYQSQKSLKNKAPHPHSVFLHPKNELTSQSTSFKLVLKHAIKPAFHGHVSPWPPRVGGFWAVDGDGGEKFALPSKEMIYILSLLLHRYLYIIYVCKRNHTMNTLYLKLNALIETQTKTKTIWKFGFAQILQTNK